MVTHRFRNFLEDRSENDLVIAYWEELWDRVDPICREVDRWEHPWLSTHLGDGSLASDGNPIFSAFSPSLRKGLRIIQYPPTSGAIEFDCWLDTFGGRLTDPEAIRELVISCALSDEAADRALGAVSDWIVGRPIRITCTHFRQPRNGITEDFAAFPVYVGEVGTQLVTL